MSFRESSDSFSFHKEDDYGAKWLGFSFEGVYLVAFKSAAPPHRSRFCLVSLLGALLTRYGVTDVHQPKVDVLHSWAVVCLAQIFGQLVSIRVRTLSNAKLRASRYVERKKTWLPVDVRRSKTPLLQPPTHLFLFSSLHLKISSVLRQLFH